MRRIRLVVLLLLMAFALSIHAQDPPPLTEQRVLAKIGLLQLTVDQLTEQRDALIAKVVKLEEELKALKEK